MGLLDILAQRDSNAAGGFMRDVAGGVNMAPMRGQRNWSSGFDQGRGALEELLRLIQMRQLQQARGASKSQSPFSKG